MLSWPKRLTEWREVSRIYLEQRGPLPIWHMVRAIISGPVPREVWRKRLLRGCRNCPVFCREERKTPDGRKWRLNACAGPHGSGCGCYCPWLALSANPGRNGCWYRDNVDDEHGWPAYRFPSIWHRLWAPVRFIFGR